MRFVGRIARSSIALFLFVGASLGAVAATESSAVEFVGSLACDAWSREFLGGLATNAPCHCIVWQLTLSTNQNKAATYKLVARYRIASERNPNISEDGPTVASHGTVEILKGARSNPDTVVYRLHAQKSQASLSFVKVGPNLLHLLNPDGSLATGSGGWSHTLNRRDQLEEPGDISQAMNVPEGSYKLSPLATGPTVFGIFGGRTPCQGIARELKISQATGCMRVKWRVTLFHDPQTSAPTTYKIENSLYREKAREGAWKISRGAKNDPNATVYELGATPTEAALLLLKGDDNVLFLLNQNRELLVGNADLSYTLSRVVRK